MRRIISFGMTALAAVSILGCRSDSTPRVVVPDETHGNPSVTYHHDAMKPLPAQRSESAVAPPFHDEPIVTQEPPEQREFVEAYARVGRPRIGVMVSPVIRPGMEDELAARNIDYAAMQTILADWFAADGQVTIISTPAATSSNASKPGAEMNVDVVVEARIEPTRQAGGPAGRLVAEAINTRGGQSLGRAVIDIPPPLSKPRLNDCTRFVARKLMDEMTGTWDAFPPAPQPAAPSGSVSSTPESSSPASPPTAPPSPPIEAPAAPAVAPPPATSAPPAVPPPPVTNAPPAPAPPVAPPVVAPPPPASVPTPSPVAPAEPATTPAR